jgi:PAS domain-containing protein
LLNDLVLVFFVVLPTAALSVWWVLRSAQITPEMIEPELPMVLFKNGTVEHASTTALDLLPITIGSHNWQDLVEIFLPRYPNFPITLRPKGSARTTLFGKYDTSQQAYTIQINWLKNGAALTFQKTEAAHSDTAVVQELEFLRDVTNSAPHPAWKTNSTGIVVWYNKAYSTLAEKLPDGEFSATQPIFDLPEQPVEQFPNRIKLDLSGDTPAECFDVCFSTHKHGTIHHATSRTALIKAEEAQKEFVQTLAKTFAHLSIGLAIFNRDRQLALFNPALIDLTGLSASFLSPRPTIDSFFDAMRENRKMPEPKNYKTWRQHMADLINAAEIGTFEEAWTLEAGQTYRVKGRPHPDGAIAFLFEDISAEVSLTRNFRAELELGQSLVDSFEDSLAVFSQSGALTFSNKAYDLLWGFQFDTSFAHVTIADAIKLWKEKSSPNPLWEDLHDSVMSLEDRNAWDMPIRIRGQLPMQCRVVPIASGATVIRFSRQTVPDALVRPLIKNNPTG